MGLAPKERPSRAESLVGLALAAGLPLACYLATASAHGYWLDSGEFVAASAELGIAHPPGHPLTALVGALLGLLPIGPWPFRVALASALSAAVAAGAFYRAVHVTLRASGLRAPSILMPLSIGTTWLVAAAMGFWFQAVRPEVYALQAALAFVVLERILTLELEWPTTDLRPLYAAALAEGLALANHHLLAFLILPAVAPTLARVYAARGPRSLAIAGGFCALGLSTYLYLPMRAAADPALNLGDPRTLDRLYWVVSAQAFQHNTGGGVPQPLGERLADVIVQLVSSLHVIPVLLALGGAYFVTRTPGLRRLGWVWIMTLLVSVLARAWLGFVRSNPDALGYLMPAFGAAAALAACFVGGVLASFSGADPREPRVVARVATLLVAALGLAQLHDGAQRASLATFDATEPFDDARVRDLPPRAIVLLYGPQTIFRFMGVQGESRLRPDVTMVPMPFLAYPSMVASILERDPSLQSLLRSILLEGAPSEAALQGLAAKRPVLLELDLRVPLSAFASVAPDGLLYSVIEGGATRTDRRLAAQRRDSRLVALYRALGAGREDPETLSQLIWLHYMDALYFAKVGDRDAALLALRRGLAINPEARELRALDEALGRATDLTKPIDVRAFFPAIP